MFIANHPKAETIITLPCKNEQGQYFTINVAARDSTMGNRNFFVRRYAVLLHAGEDKAMKAYLAQSKSNPRYLQPDGSLLLDEGEIVGEAINITNATSRIARQLAAGNITSMTKEKENIAEAISQAIDKDIGHYNGEEYLQPVEYKAPKFDQASYQNIGEIDCHNDFYIIVRAQDKLAQDWERRSQGIADRVYSLWLDKDASPGISDNSLDKEFRAFPKNNTRPDHPDGSIFLGEIDMSPDKNGKLHADTLVNAIAKTMKEDWVLQLGDDPQKKILETIESDFHQDPPLKAVSPSAPPR